MSAVIRHIYRYPVKGLSAEAMQATVLEAERSVTGDRRFALALAATRFDGQAPEWQNKRSFITLLNHQKLAALGTLFDDASNELTVLRNGKQVARGKLCDPVGRAMIEDFFAAYMGTDTPGKPSIADAGSGINFTDQKRKLVSIINLASIRDLQRTVGNDIDPVRFRANIYIDGLDPWSEFDWVGEDLAIGQARLAVVERIGRCGAINVNPENGARDENLVKALQRGFGHTDMGIFVTITQGGDAQAGDPIGPA